MEKNIPAVGWIVIICLVSLVILLNFSLWTAWKRKNSGNSIDPAVVITYKINIGM